MSFIKTISYQEADKTLKRVYDKVKGKNGEILEINQVTAYFNYANRTVLGLGVSLEGDVLGLSPNDSNDENNWSHQ